MAEFAGGLQTIDAIVGKSSAEAALWRLDYADVLLSWGMRAQARSQLDIAATS
ncbi:MAG: hypothetical protein ABJA62_10640 [Luteimonas sp.]